MESPDHHPDSAPLNHFDSPEIKRISEETYGHKKTMTTFKLNAMANSDSKSEEKQNNSFFNDREESSPPKH